MTHTAVVKDNKVFTRLFSKGKFVSCRFCTLYFKANGSRSNRLGISTSKKIGCAVLRNRARRVIRQAYRENEEYLPTGFDIIIAAREGATQCKSGDISFFLRNRACAAMNNPGKERRQ